MYVYILLEIRIEYPIYCIAVYRQLISYFEETIYHLITCNKCNKPIQTIIRGVLKHSFSIHILRV